MRIEDDPHAPARHVPETGAIPIHQEPVEVTKFRREELKEDPEVVYVELTVRVPRWFDGFTLTVNLNDMVSITNTTKAPA